MAKPKIVGNGHILSIEYIKDEDGNEREGFVYRGNTYFLDDLLAVHNTFWNPNPPEWMKPFDGYMSDSFFSGILVKYAEDDNGIGVKVYTFY